MTFSFCKNVAKILSSIWEFHKGTLDECVIRIKCWRNVKYITTGGKDWWALKGEKGTVPWKGFVFKEDQKCQIFLQLTVLLWNIARNWCFKNIEYKIVFDFPWEGLKGTGEYDFFGRNSSKARKGNMIFSYCYQTSWNIIIRWYYFKANNFQKYLYYYHFVIALL